MIDLHSHVLPGIDDGAANLEVSLAMARQWVAQGVSVVACTPHILPGVYHNTGPQIREHIASLQSQLDANDIALHLVTGADNHIVPSFVADLQRGHLLTLNDSRYVLVEPSHHTMSVGLEDLFHAIQVNGYVPVLTHPERLIWALDRYDVIVRLASRGVLMQLTAGSIVGRFGDRARNFSKRLLLDGCTHLVATDAHDTKSRPPDLLASFQKVCEWVGDGEGERLFLERPQAILNNVSLVELPKIEIVRSVSDETVSGGSLSSGAGGLPQRLWRRFIS